MNTRFLPKSFLRFILLSGVLMILLQSCVSKKLSAGNYLIENPDSTDETCTTFPLGSIKIVDDKTCVYTQLDHYKKDSLSCRWNTKKRYIEIAIIDSTYYRELEHEDSQIVSLGFEDMQYNSTQVNLKEIGKNNYVGFYLKDHNSYNIPKDFPLEKLIVYDDHYNKITIDKIPRDRYFKIEQKDGLIYINGYRVLSYPIKQLTRIQ